MRPRGLAATFARPNSNPRSGPWCRTRTGQRSAKTEITIEAVSFLIDNTRIHLEERETRLGLSSHGLAKNSYLHHNAFRVVVVVVVVIWSALAIVSTFARGNVLANKKHQVAAFSSPLDWITDFGAPFGERI